MSLLEIYSCLADSVSYPVASRPHVRLARALQQYLSAVDGSAPGDLSSEGAGAPGNAASLTGYLPAQDTEDKDGPPVEGAVGSDRDGPPVEGAVGSDRDDEPRAS